MKCPTEFTFAQYVDRELSPDGTRQVEDHLAECASCRSVVEALRAENRVLAVVMQSVEEEKSTVSAHANDWRLGLRMLFGFAAMVGIATAVVTAATWVGELIPRLFAMNLFSRTTWMNLLFSGALYLANEGADMMTTLVSALSTLLVGGLIVAGVYFLARRSASLAVLAALTLVFALPPAASALETRKGEHVTVPSSETVDGTLLAAGETVIIDGIVNGDLISSAGRILIRGEIKGDILAVGDGFDVEGKVDGNIYRLGRALDVRGTVAHTVYAAVRTARIYSGGSVGNDLFGFCDETNISGAVGRDAALFCGSADVRGRIGRHLLAHVGSLTLVPPAHVGGNLTAQVDKPNQVQIENGAVVVGKTDVEISKPEGSRYAQPRFYFWQAVQVVAALLTGIVLFALWPFLFAVRPQGTRSTLVAAGVGFLILVATPIAVLLAGITLVGLPLAIITFVTWLMGLYLAKIFVAAVIGQSVLRTGAAIPEFGSFVLALVAGLAVLFIGMNLPLVGGPVRFVVILMGVGFASMQLYYHQRRRTSPPA